MLNFTRRYNVFVSSTYRDLAEERRAVIERLIDFNFIVSNMESFCASNLEQFEYIKRIIDDCDYLVLLVGGRYGSVNEQTKKSYTEMEFDYAKEKDIPCYIFYYKDHKSLPDEKKESETPRQEMFNRFLEDIKKDKMAKSWSDIKELPLLVIDALQHAKEHEKRKGWVRGDQVSKFIDGNKEKVRLFKIESELEFIQHSAVATIKKGSGTIDTEKTSILAKEFWSIMYAPLVKGATRDVIIDLLDAKFKDKLHGDDIIRIDHAADNPIFCEAFEPYLIRKMEGNKLFIKLTDAGNSLIAKYLGIAQDKR